jgi:hypothetical protein
MPMRRVGTHGRSVCRDPTGFVIVTECGAVADDRRGEASTSQRHRTDGPSGSPGATANGRDIHRLTAVESRASPKRETPTVHTPLPRHSDRRPGRGWVDGPARPHAPDPRPRSRNGGASHRFAGDGLPFGVSSESSTDSSACSLQRGPSAPRKADPQMPPSREPSRCLQPRGTQSSLSPSERHRSETGGTRRTGARDRCPVCAGNCGAQPRPGRREESWRVRDLPSVHDRHGVVPRRCSAHAHTRVRTRAKSSPRTDQPHHLAAWRWVWRERLAKFDVPRDRL